MPFLVDAEARVDDPLLAKLNVVPQTTVTLRLPKALAAGAAAKPIPVIKATAPIVAVNFPAIPRFVTPTFGSVPSRMISPVVSARGEHFFGA